MTTAGWEVATLEDVCALITDGTHHSPPNGPTGDFRYVTAKNVRPWGLDLTDITWVTSKIHTQIFSRCPVEFEDVLYIKDGATTGIAVLNSIREQFSLLSSVALLKPNRQFLEPAFLKHWLNCPQTFARFTAGMTGSAIKRLVLRQIRTAKIEIPPLREQKRIANKLDALLAQVDACRERLDRVPGILKRFRQSVLAAATSGRLTEDWRAENPELPAAGALLERIAAERIRLALPSARRKGSIDGLPLPESGLPKSWAWCRVADIADVRLGGTPSRRESTYWGGEFLWVSSGEVANCRITEADEKITQAGLENSNAKLYPLGTVLIAMIGEGKTRGQAAILKVEAATNQNVAGLVFDVGQIAGEYIWYWALSVYEQNRDVGRGGNQPALNGAKIRAFSLPLPPLEEQQEIVRRVEILFAYADELEARVAAAKAQVERLTPALLAKAFRGELVPQDPNDESAEVLLERLRAENAGQEKKRRGGKA